MLSLAVALGGSAQTSDIGATSPAVTGIVLDDSRRPVQGATVSVDGDLAKRPDVTIGDGSFRIELRDDIPLPGEIFLRVGSPRHEVSVAKATPGASPRAMTITLARLSRRAPVPIAATCLPEYSNGSQRAARIRSLVAQGVSVRLLETILPACLKDPSPEVNLEAVTLLRLVPNANLANFDALATALLNRSSLALRLAAFGALPLSDDRGRALSRGVLMSVLADESPALRCRAARTLVVTLDVTTAAVYQAAGECVCSSDITASREGLEALTAGGDRVRNAASTLLACAQLDQPTLTYRKTVRQAEAQALWDQRQRAFRGLQAIGPSALAVAADSFASATCSRSALEAKHSSQGFLYDLRREFLEGWDISDANVRRELAATWSGCASRIVDDDLVPSMFGTLAESIEQMHELGGKVPPVLADSIVQSIKKTFTWRGDTSSRFLNDATRTLFRIIDMDAPEAVRTEFDRPDRESFHAFLATHLLAAGIADTTAIEVVRKQLATESDRRIRLKVLVAVLNAGKTAGPLASSLAAILTDLGQTDQDAADAVIIMKTFGTIGKAAGEHAVPAIGAALGRAWADPSSTNGFGGTRFGSEYDSVAGFVHSVPKEAALALATYGPDGVGALHGLLQWGCAEPNEPSFELAIRGIGPAANLEYRTMLDSKGDLVRKNCVCQILTRWVTPSSDLTGSLAGLFAAGYVPLTLNALEALRHMGPDARAAVPEIRKLLKHRNPTVKQKAESALNAIDPVSR